MKTSLSYDHYYDYAELKAALEDFAARYKKTKDESIDLGNYLMTLDKKVDTDEYVKTDGRIKALRAELESIELEKQNLIKQRVASYKNNASLVAANEKALAELKAKREQKRQRPQAERPADRPHYI